MFGGSCLYGEIVICRHATVRRERVEAPAVYEEVNSIYRK
jgi:hypothetical protein